MHAIAYGAPNPIEVAAALRSRAGVDVEIRGVSAGRLGLAVDVGFRETGRLRLLRWYGPVTAEDGGWPASGTLMGMGATGFARETLALILEGFGGALEQTGAEWDWIDRSCNVTLTPVEALSAEIAEAIGWNQVLVAVGIAESLASDPGIRRRFRNALDRTAAPSKM